MMLLLRRLNSSCSASTSFCVTAAARVGGARRGARARARTVRVGGELLDERGGDARVAVGVRRVGHAAARW